jgi:hypothetical protein
VYRAFANSGFCANTVKVARHIIYHFRPFIPFAYPYALGYPLKMACPWENGYVESFNSKLRDELLKRELFSSLDYMAPAAFAAKCLEQGSGTLRLTQDKENSCGILS